MRLTRTLALAATAAAALCMGTVIPAAAAAPAPGNGDAPSYQEFAASTYRDVDGSYIVNGDEVIATQGDLRAFYEQLVGPDTHTDGLIVNTVNGADDKWSASQVGNLTYCVSTKFGTRHADVVSAMASGAALWESASSKIDFVHVSSADGNCTTRNKSVLFSVEPVQTSQYIARAFFPSSPDRQQNVLIDDSIWTSGSWTPTNIIGHELGHVLGFRHEHTRPESGTCFEDSNWRPLTPYDSSSIMHYPQCNGSSDDLSMTSADRAGVVALYGN
ncbi:M57 family metalloprotease [Microbacterium sp. SD291]|uniref:M57 family metalloprotease n=1 Tax=Microbacterium sp. SD291 TaxID=2782007 RepID=UPI001A975582|nr:M57 family metalloprotease [Microbacterium sp. SD291]MBO0980712.1 peptidase M16 [Microbacterium sp. SD291]